MSEIKNYRVIGKMLIGGEWQKFTFEARGLSKKHVIERVYSELGSRHKLKRSHIKIERIEEIPPEEIRNPLLRQIAFLEVY